MPRGKKAVQTKAPTPERKKSGPKPLTEAQKKARAEQRAETMKKAENMVPAVILQYQGSDMDLQDLIESVKTAFKGQHKRTLITDMKIYIKPEEHAAYYVINGSFDGKVEY